MSVQTAVFPGTFDPVTNGHVALIKRALRVFDRVVVTVAAGSHKNTRFSLDERIRFVQAVFADEAAVDVEPLQGLLVNKAKALNAQVVVRGLRNSTDFDYETQLAQMNQHLSAGLETLFLPPDTTTGFISSSLVKEIAGMGGDVSAMVPPVVLKAMASEKQ